MRIAALGSCLVALATGWATAGTATGEVVVDGADVYVVGDESVRVIGDAGDASSFAGRLASLRGEQVTIRGPLRTEAVGRAIVPKIWVDPQFVELAATLVEKNIYTNVYTARVHGQVVPATGLLLPEAPANARFEAYVFRSEDRITRVHLGRAHVTYDGRAGYVRRFETVRRAWAIPLPPGNPTFLRRWTEHRFAVEDRQGNVIEASPKLKRLTFVQGRPVPASPSPSEGEAPASPPTAGITGSLGD